MEFIETRHCGIVVPTENATMDLAFAAGGNITATLYSPTEHEAFCTIQSHIQTIGVVTSRLHMRFRAWLRLNPQTQIEIPAQASIELEKVLSTLQLVDSYTEAALAEVAAFNPNAQSSTAWEVVFIFLQTMLLNGEPSWVARGHIPDPMTEEISDVLEQAIESNTIQFLI